jgi:drug/metabolite transporter (DMT)-like permease
MNKTQKAKQDLNSVGLEYGLQAETPECSRWDRIGVPLALFALYIIWGSTYLGMRLAIESIPVFLMSGIRFLLAGGILYGALRVRHFPNPSPAQWMGGALVGLLLVVGGNGGIAFAEQWVATGLAAVAAGAMPLWAAFLIGLMGRWPTRREWLGLLLGFVGILLLNLEDGMWAMPLGAIALVLAPLCWALGSALSSQSYLSLPAGLMASAVQMLVGGGVLLLIGLLSHEQVSHLPTPGSLGALVYLILFGSLVGYTCYGYLLQKVRPALATSYAYVNPAVALVLGVVLAGEHITRISLLAMVIILTGVGFVSLGRDRRSSN